MSEWRTLVLGPALEQLLDHRGRTPRKLGSDWSRSGVQVISAKLVVGGHLNLERERRYVSWDVYERWMPVKLAEWDVLLTSEAPLGKSALVRSSDALCLGQRLFALRPDPQHLDARFLFYWIQSPAGQSALSERASGTTVLGIRQAELVQVAITAPSVRMQRTIGEILGAIDDLIENNRRRVEVLEGMTQLIYREWFVRFRYPGHEDVPLVDSPLGPIPGGWSAQTIGDVLELRYGKALKKGSRRGGPVSVVSSAGIVGRHDEVLVQGPTIVVGRKGNVGSVTWVDGAAWPIDTAYFVETTVPLRYVVEQLRRTEFLNTHAAVPGLSRDQAYSRPFLRPSMPLMEQFEAVAGSLAEEARMLAASCDRLSALRDLLLPALVTGKIDVSQLDLDALAEAAIA